MPRALHLRDRQDRRHPPRRVRHQPARPCRRGLRPGQAAALLTAVGKNTVVSLKVELYDAQGALLQPASEVTYVHGGHGGLFEALERALEGRQPGETVRVQLEPDQAFGDYDAGLIRLEPLERYGEGVAVGMEIEEDSTLYTVTDVAGGKVVLDANHPLAGMALRFVCQVDAVRIASPEEIERGVSLPPKQ